MKVFSVGDAKTFQNVHGVDARKIYDSEHAEVIHMALAPGQSLKKHTTPVDVFFYILEGKGIVEIGDEAEEVKRDMLIDSPKGIPHLVRSTGDSLLRFLVVKVPKQKEPAKVHQ